MKRTYFLLGQDAVVTYQEHSINKLLEEKGEHINYDILKIDEHTDPLRLMSKVDGWMGWCEIPEEDYNILYNHMNPPDEEFEFDFHRDAKHTIWYRSHFSVKAKTREEAIEKAIEMMVNFDRDDSSELLVDTTEEMSPKDNEGCSTEELFLSWESGDALWSNGL